MNHFRAGVELLPLACDRDREHVALRSLPHEEAGRILHRHPTPQIAVYPLHPPMCFYPRPFGHEVVDVLVPILHRRIPHRRAFADDDFHDRRVERSTTIDWRTTALHIMDFGSWFRDDQRPLKLTRILCVDAKVCLEWQLDHDAGWHIDETPPTPHCRV